MLQREEEHCLLDIEINNFVKRDWSGLARSDRDLRMHIPLNTAPTDEIIGILDENGTKNVVGGQN